MTATVIDGKAFAADLVERVEFKKGVHYAENACHLVGFENCETTPQRSLIAQIAAATFGSGCLLALIQDLFSYRQHQLRLGGLV